jgi:hypothetical protein
LKANKQIGGRLPGKRIDGHLPQGDFINQNGAIHRAKNGIRTASAENVNENTGIKYELVVNGA